MRLSASVKRACSSCSRAAVRAVEAVIVVVDIINSLLRTEQRSSALGR